MKTKILSAFLMALIMTSASFTSCTDKKEDISSENSAAKPTEIAAQTAPPTEPLTMPELEETHAAQSSDAYLAISDGAEWIQYQGNTNDDGYMLSYDAEIAHISKDGEYSVSVNADTDGFRYYVTGKVDGEYTPSGCSHAAVIIKNGAELYPNANIEITSIKIDGNEIPITASHNSYTDENRNICSDIFSSEDDSSRIVDKEAFDNGWLKVEVTFNVTGIVQ